MQVKDIIPILCGVLVGVTLMLPLVVRAASSEHINQDKVCDNRAREAGDIFDLVTANPKVILNGMGEGDEDEFAFVREWVKDNKTREGLIEYVKQNCMGTPI